MFLFALVLQFIAIRIFTKKREKHT
jgi:hypothetical protein